MADKKIVTKKNSLIILGIIVIGIVFYIILSSPPLITTPEGGPETEVPEAEAPATEEALLLELKTIEIVASKDGFSPPSFKVKTKEKIILKINYLEKGTGHTFSFQYPELGLRGAVGSGEDIDDLFSAPAKPGEYEFYDEVMDGSREKIIGKMIVE